MKARSEAREARRAAFLAALRQGVSVAMAVASIGAGRGTVYKWRRKDAAFARAWADAVEEGTGLIEAEGLRRGMPLQSDPTTIYGIGETFDGNLRRDHLRADTPYNTYTRGGLTPTPISMPGKGALAATANPGRTSALYFVSRGDGTSEFSETLDSHNRAVNRYQRKVR